MTSASQTAEAAVDWTCSLLSTLSLPKRSLAADWMSTSLVGILDGPVERELPRRDVGAQHAGRVRRTVVVDALLPESSSWKTIASTISTSSAAAPLARMR